MHWKARREWYYNQPLLARTLDVARRLRIPVLLHTGDYKECHARVFMDLCFEHPDLTFVLAHGWPVGETMEVLAQCENVCVDTAFMPVKNAVSLVQQGFAGRMLFGTDVPINQLFYKDLTTADYIKNCLTALQSELPPESFTQILTNTIYYPHPCSE